MRGDGRALMDPGRPWLWRRAALRRGGRLPAKRATATRVAIGPGELLNISGAAVADAGGGAAEI